jgi:hypothetical protein
MRSFVFHIEDDRSDSAAVRRASLRDEFEAQVLAGRILRETYHHRSVAVWEDSRQVCRLTTEGA